MYRCGYEGIYARSDYNKFSCIKHQGYTTFQENVLIRHKGFEVSRNDGLIELPKKLISFEEIKAKLLSAPIDDGDAEQSKCFI